MCIQYVHTNVKHTRTHNAKRIPYFSAQRMRQVFAIQLSRREYLYAAGYPTVYPFQPFPHSPPGINPAWPAVSLTLEQ